MTLKEYAENINTLLKKRPETADFVVVTSRDDEGNGFNLVYYAPSVGNYNKDDNDFTVEKELNAVCVN
jgi:hypothetical protein